MPQMPLASIPSPSHAAWRSRTVVGPGLRAVRDRRDRRRGGRGRAASTGAAAARRGVILDVAAWAVPFGLVGAAAHAILLDTRHDFGDEHRLWHAVTVGVAAIGVPGAVALGAAGAWIACRRAGVAARAGGGGGRARAGVRPGRRRAWATGGRSSSMARPRPGGGRSGSRPTHRVPGYENYGTFQPAFLYQSLWDVAVGLGVIWAARRWLQAQLSGERTFLLCAACYAVGQLLGRVGAHRPAAAGPRACATARSATWRSSSWPWLVIYLTRPGRSPPARRSSQAELW